MRMTRFALIMIVVTLGCGHAASQSWTAQPVSSDSIRVMPSGISVRHGRLYVQTNFTNTSPEPITVERDGAVLRLPDGRVLGRSVGVFTQHKPYVIPPGGSHAVYVDFKAEGFDWTSVDHAEVDWSNAVYDAHQKQLAIPPTQLVAHQAP